MSAGHDLLPAQTEVWLAQSVRPTSPEYTVGEVVDVVGALDVAAFREAVRRTVAETPTLNRVLVPGTGGRPPSWADGDRSRVPVEYHDLRDRPDPAAAAEALLDGAVGTLLDPTGPRAFRHLLLRTADDRHRWASLHHHAVIDGVGVSLVARRIADVYSALVAGDPAPPCPFGDPDDVRAEDDAYRRSEEYGRDRAYWTAQVDGLPGAASPTVRDRCPSAGFHRSRETLPPDGLAELDRACDAAGVRRSSMLVALVAAHWHRLTGEPEIVVGLVVAARRSPAARTTPTMTSNVVPVRVPVRPGEPVAELARRTGAAVADALAHQRFRMEDVRRLAGLDHRESLYPVLVNPMAFDYDLRFGDCTTSALNLSTGPVEDMAVSFYDRGDGRGAVLDVDANAAGYTPGETRAHAEGLRALLSATAATMADVRVAAVPTGAAPDLPGPDAPALRTAPALVAEQVARHPDADAVVGASGALTYAELDRRADEWAGALAARGAGPGTVVGLALPRGTDMVVAMLAVWRAGAAYLPVDPELPPRRLRGLLDESAPAVVVARRDTGGALPAGTPVLLLDEPFPAGAATPRTGPGPHDPAHVLHTSGSTGRPKGVVVTHAGYAGLVAALTARAGIGPGTRVLQFCAPTFDVSVGEIAGALATGATLVTGADGASPTGPALAALIREQHVTHALLTPTVLATLDPADVPAGLTVVVGGEACPAELAARWESRARLVNGYGPTEATVYATCGAPIDGSGPAPLGDAVPGVRLHVLDAVLRPVAPGLSGELYLGGPALARGYLGRPALTAERFVAAPDGPPGSLLYRTGDLVRRTAGGDLEYLGRHDGQVKILGRRIELGEIEGVLSTADGVAQAAVVADRTASGATRLLGYVVPAADGPRPDPAALRGHAAGLLPAHMVPAAVTVLDALPRTSAGKLDVRRLPRPVAGTTARREPRPGAETVLTGLVRSLLDDDGAGPDDDFFVIGGDSILSLQLVGLARERGLEITTQEVFDLRTAAALAATARAPRAPEPQGAAPAATRALTPLQRGLLFHTLYTGDGPDDYLLQVVLDLHGDVRPQALRDGLRLLVRRHDVLRTAFPADGTGGADDADGAARVADDADPDWAEHDLADLDDDARDAEADRLVRADRERRMDVTRPPLLRGTLIRTGPDRYRLVLAVHHLVVDGWSLPILVRELFAAHDGRAADLPPARSFGEHLELLGRRDRDGALRAWRSALDGLEGPTLLGVGGGDGVGDGVGSGGRAVEQYDRQLAPDATAALTAFARRHGVTVNSVLQAAWALVLGALTGRTDVVFGSVVSGRPPELPAVGDRVGPFVNTVPVRVRTRPEETVAALCARVQSEQTALLEHQHAGLDEIRRATGFDELFDTLLVFENYPHDPGDWTGSTSASVVRTAVHDVNHYPLSVLVLPGPQLGLRVTHRPHAVSSVLADRAVTALTDVLSGLGDGTGDGTGHGPVVSRLVLADPGPGPDTRRPLPAHTLPELIDARIAADPHREALVDGDLRLDYAALGARVHRLARYLAGRGIGTGDVVAVRLERSADFVVTALAVLTAGAAYLPLDPAEPADRTRRLVAEADPALVVGRSDDPGPLPDRQQVAVDAVPLGHLDPSPLTDADRVRPLHPSSTAYVLYTSGSTGAPKGVAVPCAALVNRLLWMSDEDHLAPGDRLLHKTPTTFDVSVWEIVGTFVAGATMVVAEPDGHRDPGYLAGLIRAERVTVAHFVPSMLRAFVADPASAGCGSLRHVICSGEALPADLVAASAERLGVRLSNLYGPTEAAVDVTAWTWWPGDDVPPVPPIGSPAWNTACRVLDPYLRPAPDGTPGELYLAGDQLALGYLARPGLTAERFVADPYGPPGAVLYRTGDLVRRRADGDLEHLGRTDDQVKVRGYRVELGEVDAALTGLPGVAAACATVRRDGTDGRIVAHVVLDGDADPGTLRAAVARVLPEHAVPAVVVAVDALPLTSSGKTDRSALAALAVLAAAPGELPGGDTAGGTAAERVFGAAFAAALDRAAVGRDDDFFALGGDSILSLRMVAAARAAGFEVTPREVFAHRTPAALAQAARPLAPAAPAPALPDDGDLPATPIIGWLTGLGSAAVSGTYQSVVLVVPPAAGVAPLATALSALRDRHGALRLRLAADGTPVVDPPGGDTTGHVRRVPAPDGDGRAWREVVAAASAAARDRLDPWRGALVEAVWFDAGPDRDGRLLLVVHHLAVDGVSWRILLPELARAWADARDGREPAQPPAGPATSFREWAHRLPGAALARDGELARWEAVLAGSDPLLGDRPADPGRDTAATAGELTATLGPDVAAALLTDVPAAFRARVDEVLLTAFALAVLAWRHDRGTAATADVLIGLEGHGREPLDDGLPEPDLSRTVGWFTTRYPVRLAPGGSDGVPPPPADAVKAVKEQLRAVPSSGIGFGLLRHLHPEARDRLADLPEPQIGVNYLGRFPVPDGSAWQPDPVFGALSGGRDPGTPLPHGLSLDALTEDRPDGPHLVARWSWATGLLDADAVADLSRRWFDAAAALVAHVRDGGPVGHSPSDFGLVALSQTEVDELDAAHPGLVTVWPTTPLQRGLLLHATEPSDPARPDDYAVALSLDLDGPLDPARWRAAVDALPVRHPALRSVFVTRGAAEPVVVVPAVAPVPWRDVDLSGVDDVAGELGRVVRAARAEPFRPAEGGLLRATLVRVAPDRHRLLLTAHHLVVDGWSLSVLVRDLLALHDAGGDPSVPGPAVPVERHLTRLAAGDRDAALRRWRAELDALDGPTLVADGPSDPAVAPGVVERELSAAATAGLDRAARDGGLTANSVVSAVWAVVLGWLTGRDDVVFGTVVSGRPADLDGADRIVGLLANTLPARVRLDPHETLAALCGRVQDEQAALLDHQHVGLADVHAAAGTSPLFDTLFVFENYPLDTADLRCADGGPTVTALHGEDGNHYPLGVVVLPGDRMRLRVTHRPDVVAPVRAAAVADALVGLLTTLGEILDRPVARIRPVEHDPVPDVVPAPAGPDTLVTRFREQARRRPGAVAVVDGDRTLTYDELDRAAERAARRLRAMGAGPERVVALAVDRRAELVVAVLAVLYSGAVYLPVDPAYPPERIALVLDDAAPVCALTAGRADVLPASLPVLDLLEPLDPAEARGSHEPTGSTGSGGPVDGPPTAAHGAYLIYTSGSTGRPKGVLVPHRNVLRLFDATADVFGFRDDDVWTLFHSYAFDFSVWELWGPLLHGGTLVVVPYAVSRSAEDFLDLLVDRGVTVLNQTPTAFHQLTAALANRPAGHARPGLRHVVFGGERLETPRLRDWFDHAGTGTRLVNMYGITETTVHVTHTLLDPADTAEGSPSRIGEPLADLRAYLLDDWLRPVGPGAVGELYVGGPGLARGYRGRPGLTAGRFVADVLVPGERMYRTGDRARRDERGELVFEGRSDEQVSLRGFRIEPGEVASVLAGADEVADAAVVVREDVPGAPRLVSYVVPDPALDDGAPATVARRAAEDRAAETLPEHMVPAAVVPVGEIPLTPNGKLDRAALPAPDFAARAGDAQARTPQEETLAACVAEALGVPSVGVHDDFYALGGDSILAIRLVSIARRAGLLVAPADVLAHRTVAELAARAGVADAAGTPSGDADDAVGELPATPIIERLRQDGGPIDGNHLSMTVRVPPAAGLPELAGALQAVLDRHDVLRLRMTPQPGRWVLEVRPPGAVVASAHLERVAVTGEPDWPRLVAAESLRRRDRLDPAAGRMTDAVWFDAGPERPGRLLVLLHHLVVDGVSWRVLLPDLAHAWTETAAGRDPRLRGAATSYRTWARTLAAEALRPEREAELERWTAMFGRTDSLPGVAALDPTRDTAASAATLALDLPEHETAALLDVPAACGTDLRDVLYAAFAVAVGDWRAERGPDVAGDGVLVDLQAHGRERVGAVDPSATVGWFTAQFPLLLDPGPRADRDLATGAGLAGCAARVRDQLDALPGHGIGYGLLRYLNPRTAPVLAGLGDPRIAVNFLGRFRVGERSVCWEPTGEAGAAMGGGVDDGTPLPRALVLTVAVEDREDGPRLAARWLWAPRLFGERDVPDLAERWFAVLRAFVRAGAGPTADVVPLGGRAPVIAPVAGPVPGPGPDPA